MNTDWHFCYDHWKYLQKTKYIVNSRALSAQSAALQFLFTKGQTNNYYHNKIINKDKNKQNLLFHTVNHFNDLNI